MSTQDRRQHERVRRKQDILLAARAIFAQYGFRSATVQQIAQRAEIAKGTVYLYFASKEDILAELVLCALNDLATALQQAGEARPLLHPELRLRAMAEAYLIFSQRAPDDYRLLTAFDGGGLADHHDTMRDDKILVASNRTLDLVTQAIADGVALGLFVCPDARQAAASLWAGLNGSLALLAHPIRRSMIPTDAPGLYHATLDLLLRGLSRPASDGHEQQKEKGV